MLPPLATEPLASSAPTADSPHWRNRFATLGDRFFTLLPAEPLPQPHWVAWSPDCAQHMGFSAACPAPDSPWLQILSGNALAPGMQPLASVYSGHQFGSWAGQLGDGRALWLGEMDTPGGPLEVQLKGAGRTPYSRRGDGRAVLRSSIREFLCSEAMAGLGIPTTRALCITGSALPVWREDPETAAVVTRVAESFIRFGHFEHFAHTAADTSALQALADFVISHHYPGCAAAAQPVLALLQAVTTRTAELMADWQAVGFCHGVMNTDNMSILGLTLDYGPFGFLDGFNPAHICNHSDTQGRYAYGRQPSVAFWNLHALAQALLPLMKDSDAALAVLETYKAHFAQTMMARMRAKLGLHTVQADDQTLIDELLALMAADHTDYTLTFRRLAGFSTSVPPPAQPLRDLFIQREAFDAWAERYSARLRAEGSADTERAARMNRVNPKYILRNHLAEQAIRQAQQGDFSETQRLMQVLARPYDEHPEHAAYADLPPDWAQHIEVSCSS